MSLKQYDIIEVARWDAHQEGDDPVKILSMPNIPRPLHTMAPRTILPPSAWNFMRKHSYRQAGYKCEVCGKDLTEDPYEKQAHELYSVDYVHHRSVFQRCVCLCKRHHTEPGVHTGRALTMFKHNNVLMPKEKIIAGAEDIFRRVYEYNTERKPASEPELRLFYVFAQIAENDKLKDEMTKLIKKYHIKFYRPCVPEEDNWSDWRLVIGGKEYEPVFKDYDDWAKQMESAPKSGREKTDEEKKLDDDFEELEKKLLTL